MATSVITCPYTFDDVFRELNEELEMEAREYHLNSLYLNFDSKISDKDEHQSFFSIIPEYLSASNLTLRATFLTELRVHSLPIDFFDLQRFIILKHQLFVINLHRQLWQHLLHIGTGQIKSQEHRIVPQSHGSKEIPAYWPEWVTTIIKSKGILSAHEHEPLEDDLIYVNFIKNYLLKLEEKAHQCRLQFETLQHTSSMSSQALHDKIDQFVYQEGLVSMQLNFQSRMILLNYICFDRIYQWDYVQQHKPTNSQLQLARDICSLTFEKEKATQDLLLLKSNVLFKKLSVSFELLEGSLPMSINSITNPAFREKSINEYQQIIERTKADLLRLLITVAEAKQNDCQMKFTQKMAELQENQPHSHEPLPLPMHTLIEQRQANINNCLQAIYKLKTDFFLRLPTMRRTHC